MTEATAFKSGFVAIVGKPNAGKSTLMNSLLGMHLSIATHKAQTTRHQITGILTDEQMQLIFLDTPGLIKPKYKLQEYMMRFVEKAQQDADLILLLVDATDQRREGYDFEQLAQLNKPILLVVNKIDKATQEEVKEAFDWFKEHLEVQDTLALSALESTGVDYLKERLYALMPAGPMYYPEDEMSVHPMRFFASELLREQLFVLYQEEVPYMTQIEITKYEESPEIDRIYAEIIVSRQTQKGILIGKGGKALKRLGIQARKSMESFLGKQVYLDMHVKVREGWRDNDRFLKSFGYDADAE
jgi:GTP-binding protein Era